MSDLMQTNTLDGQRRLRGLMLAAAAYLAATFALQSLGSTPSSLETAPIEISTDIVASLGLLYAAICALRSGKHPQVRQSWLYGCAGMFLVWASETAIDRLDIDYRVAIAGWLCATMLLFRSMQSYATRRIVTRIMWFGFLVQVAAHVAWIVMAELPASARGPDAALELTADTGELVSLLAYIVAFVMARHSGLDELVLQGRDRLSAWASDRSGRVSTDTHRIRICFPLIAQVHQAFHSLPIAVALSRHPEIEVHVAAVPSRLDGFRELVRRHAGTTALQFDPLYLAWPGSLLDRFRIGLAKILTLRGNRHYLSGFDAVVVPERTTTYMRRICPQIRLIFTEHGAGDRAISFSPQIAHFDFSLLPGIKQARTMVEMGVLKPGRYVAGIYAKLDWALTRDASGTKLFDNDRPIVLYNPHFESSLSSWPLVGMQVLDHFAASTQYNLIFAPHIRMFDPPSEAKYAPFAKYRHLSHMRIDLGSVSCADMTYTRAADIYIGDVSSQVVEFVTRPRPCIFLNPRKTSWESDLHYRFWHLGQVLEDVAQLDAALAAALPLPEAMATRQRAYLRDTLGEIAPGEAAARGAEAIIEFLKSEGLRTG
jgi:hypothetical protein